MQHLATQYGKGRVKILRKRALKQCMRELLLAQGSDWPFIINDGTATEYAERRVKDHVARFHFLANAIEQETISEEHLAALEYLDNLFLNVNYKLFA
jgi:1,4-alpha-glucan branching enzyme